MKLKMLLVFLVIGLYQSQAQDHATQANKILALLDNDLKAKARYNYDDEERLNWAFVPRSRNGVSLNKLNTIQKDAIMALVKSSLSEQGYKKASGVLELEGILREVEGRGAHDTYRDPLNYYFTIFGTPSNDKPWGWRFEGHHVSLNFSSVDGLIASSTPSFLGSNPAIVPRGTEKGKQLLKDETEIGFALVNSLSADQLKTARFSETALPEIVTGNDRKARALEPKGISYPSLNEEQKKTFMQLLDVYVKNYQLGFSAKLMDKIKKAGIDNLSFAWAGSLKPGAGHYYRIQGPMLLIEYDNTQTNANHVHTSVRDLTNDFAEDILREHYKRDHK